MAPIYCAVQNCKTTSFNKPVGVFFHRCPQNSAMRSKWLRILKNRCNMLDWEDSRICSKHFEHKYFDSHRRLKDNAFPTLFTNSLMQPVPKVERTVANSKVDRLLNKLTQAELTANVKHSLSRMKEPINLDNFVTDDLRSKPDASVEAQLWLIIKKQENLNNRLTNLVIQTKKHVDALQNQTDASSVSVKKEHTHSVESLKYIIKCLQEKQATLEEQVQILTTVESR